MKSKNDNRKVLRKYWKRMRNRCYNLLDYHFARYGGREIEICKEWRSSFNSFYKWSMENGFKPGLAIDRIDNDGNYEPDNCQWISVRENSMKDFNPEIAMLLDHEVIEMRGKYSSMSVSSLAEMYRVPESTIRNALRGRTYRHLSIPRPRLRRRILFV